MPTRASTGCAAVVERAADATDSEVAALALEAWAVRRLRTFEDAERGLCFGRLDLDTTPKPLYVGRRWVHDDDESELLVVNWQAPAARPFYVGDARPTRTTSRCAGGSAPRGGGCST